MSESTSQQVTEIKSIINALISDFDECLKSIEDVVESNDEQKSSLDTMAKSFEELESHIAETNTRIDSI